MTRKGMSSPRAQRGAGKLTVLLLLVMLIFVIVLAARLVPIYFDHYYTRTIVASLLEETEGPFDRRQFLEDFQRRARVNQVQLDSAAFSFTDGDPVRIALEYERRVPVLYNVDAVVSFREGYTYP